MLWKCFDIWQSSCPKDSKIEGYILKKQDSWPVTRLLTFFFIKLYFLHLIFTIEYTLIKYATGLRVETGKDMLTILRIQNKWSFIDDTVSEES